jgi:pyruvate-formate lyase
MTRSVRMRAWQSSHERLHERLRRCLDAQKHPELHLYLVVRIAGYCAYFVNLSPAQQAEINARTEERI